MWLLPFLGAWWVFGFEEENEADRVCVCDADGFFDAGMLLQALKKGDDGPKPADIEAHKRRMVGKRLALTEY